LHLPSITSIASIAFNRKITAGGPSQLFVLLGMLWKGQKNFQHSRKLVSETVESYHIQPPKFLFEVIRNYSALNVVYTSKAFQPYGETFDSQQFKFVGPTFPPASDTSNFPFSELGKQPLIYISMGTIYNKDTSFFRTCIEAFARSKWQVVMTLGSRGSLESLGTLPANFIVRNYVPQDEVLQNSVLFITNGGTNSVNQALYHNVPMILIPQSVDHPWNARRVAELGAGKVLSKKQVTASSLRAAAEEVLSQPDYARAAATIGESLRTAGGPQKAAEEIAAFKLKNCIA
jgi:MGT family glycosyltransferase